MIRLSHIIQASIDTLGETDEGRVHESLILKLQKANKSGRDKLLIPYKQRLQNSITSSILILNISENWVPSINKQLDRQLIADSIAYNIIQSFLIPLTDTNEKSLITALEGWLYKQRLILGRVKVNLVNTPK